MALLLVASSLARSEWALVNIIRHGERTDNASNPHLSFHGVRRARYIARCASQSDPSMAFPLGPPTHLLASLRPEKSVRPLETLEPLAAELDLHLGNNVNMADTERFIQFVHGLPSGATALIAWQHWWITWLLKAVYPNAPAYPDYCPYSQWSDLPEYTHGRCYDIVYQVRTIGCLVIAASWPRACLPSACWPPASRLLIECYARALRSSCSSGEAPTCRGT